MNKTISKMFWTVLCMSVMQAAAQDKTELINLNPDPNGEPWIAGGFDLNEWREEMAELPLLEMGRTLAKSAAEPLPAVVDNSKHKAFRPVFNQRGGSCAQANGIGYMFTYEINCVRNLASNTLDNQYPYDYTYNFLNGGKAGTSSARTAWDMIAANGIPNAKMYGGFGLGQHTRWVSGYDIYHSGMENRLESQFALPIKTQTDLNKMRQWLHDRGNGSPEGGLLAIGTLMGGIVRDTLKRGTPESGKDVTLSFGTSGGHLMTIVGYNDSVRYDYNGDGRYTNNIDLNGDSIIDLRDREYGALIVVNSWGRSWADSGKTYVTYKCMADAGENGEKTLRGIIVNSKSASYKPSLVYKIKMAHSRRGFMRLKVGYANLPTATTALPTSWKTVSEFFNYKGGDFPMNGTNDTPIEFALDISDILPNLTDDNSLFLEVTSDSGYGIISEFSLMDYTSTEVREFICPTRNVSILPGRSVLKIRRYTGPNMRPAIFLVEPKVNDTLLAPANINITASTYDTDGAIARVDFYNGLEKLGESIAPPFSFNWTNVPTGTYYITARTTDFEGRSAVSARRAVTVVSPNAFPIIKLVLPLQDAVFTSPAQITINASANDADGTIAKVEYFNGAEKLSEFTAPPYVFVWDSVTTGTYSISAVATDNKGAKTETRQNIFVSAPNSMPEVTITSPENGKTFSDPEVLTITAEASDLDGTVEKVVFYIDSIKVGEANSAPYSIQVPNVKSGTITVFAKAIDNEEAITTSNPIQITIEPSTAAIASLHLKTSALLKNNRLNLQGHNNTTFTITCHNLKGSLISSKTVRGNATINLNSILPTGVYFVRVTSDREMLLKRRVTVLE